MINSPIFKKLNEVLKKTPRTVITLSGDVPSKKNSKRTIYRKQYGQTRKFIVPSLAHEIWHNEQFSQINKLKVRPVENPQTIFLTFWPRTKGRADLTNKAESVMDLLVDCKIIPDDNWFEVSLIPLFFGGVDKENPRVEILIL